MTPNSKAFSIWGVIFLSQAAFVVAQCLPGFRHKALIRKGVRYYYIGTCIFQAAWTFAFAYEIMWLSLMMMIAIWWSLLMILYSQYQLSSKSSLSDTARLFDFWLFSFPFDIHCGWITAATALNMNVLVIDQGGSAAAQLAVAIVTLATLHAVSVVVLFLLKQPNYTVAGVVAWATWWIFVELIDSPKPLIFGTFSSDTIRGVAYAAVGIATIVLTQIAIRVFAAAMQFLRDRDNDEATSSTPASSLDVSNQGTIAMIDDTTCGTSSA